MLKFSSKLPLAVFYSHRHENLNFLLEVMTKILKFLTSQKKSFGEHNLLTKSQQFQQKWLKQQS